MGVGAAAGMGMQQEGAQGLRDTPGSVSSFPTTLQLSAGEGPSSPPHGQVVLLGPETNTRSVAWQGPEGEAWGIGRAHPK